MVDGLLGFYHTDCWGVQTVMDTLKVFSIVGFVLLEFLQDLDKGAIQRSRPMVHPQHQSNKADNASSGKILDDGQAHGTT